MAKRSVQSTKKLLLSSFSETDILNNSSYIHTYTMEPSSLLTTIINSDSLFSRDIKRTIVKDGITKMVLELEEGVMIKNKDCKYTSKDLEMEDMLSILEHGKYEYWVWNHDIRTCSRYDLDELKEFIDAYSGEYDDSIYDEYYFSHKTIEVVKDIISELIAS